MSGYTRSTDAWSVLQNNLLKFNRADYDCSQASVDCVQSALLRKKHPEQTGIHKHTCKKKEKHAQENAPPPTISPSTVSERPWLEATAGSCGPGNMRLNALFCDAVTRVFAGYERGPGWMIRTIYGRAKQSSRTVHVCILTNQGRGDSCDAFWDTGAVVDVS